MEMMGPLMPPPSPNVETRDGDVDSIKYRIYTPKEAASKGPLPVGMYFHSSGWTVGDLNADDLFCRAVAEHTPTILVSVDYRLGPDHKWPTQLQDCLTVYNWVCFEARSSYCSVRLNEAFRFDKIHPPLEEIPERSTQSASLLVLN